MSFVQGAAGNGNAVTSVTATFGAAITAGNAVWGILSFDNGSGATISSITVNGVSSNIKDNVLDTTNNQRSASFILGNNSGGTAVVANFTGGSPSFIELIAIEESGCLAAADPTDVHTGQQITNTGATDAITSGNVTTTVANDIIVGSVSNATSSTSPAAGTGFTLRTTNITQGYATATENGKTQASPGSVAATFSEGGTAVFVAFVIAIKPTAVSVVEGPPQFSPRAFPAQWNLDRQLLRHRRAGPEFSLTPETNTHFVPRAFPPQWRPNPLLMKGTAQDLTSPAVETNIHWRNLPWPAKWGLALALTRNPATDIPVVVTADTPAAFVPRTLPVWWKVNIALQQGTAQDLTSPAVETNPHWRGLQWPTQWSPMQALMRDPAMDVPPPPAADTPTYFIPRQWDSQWNVDVSLVQAGAQDETSPAVETNQHWPGKPWLAQWARQLSLWQNPAVDVPTVIITAETNPPFVPRQLPLWWNINRGLGRGTAQDLTSPAVETNTHWIGKPWPLQWSLNRALGQNPALDVPIVQQDTPTYFKPWTYPVQWKLNLSLNRNTSQYFNLVPADTGFFVLTGIDAALLAPSLLPPIVPFLQWNLERAGWPKRRRKPTLLEILADVIEKDPPPKVAKKDGRRQKVRAAAQAQRWAEEIVQRAQVEAKSYELNYAKDTIDAALREHAKALIDDAVQRRLDREEEEALLLLLSHYH